MGQRECLVCSVCFVSVQREPRSPGKAWNQLQRHGQCRKVLKQVAMAVTSARKHKQLSRSNNSTTETKNRDAQDNAPVREPTSSSAFVRGGSRLSFAVGCLAFDLVDRFVLAEGSPTPPPPLAAAAAVVASIGLRARFCIVSSPNTTCSSPQSPRHLISPLFVFTSFRPSGRLPTTTVSTHSEMLHDLILQFYAEQWR